MATIRVNGVTLFFEQHGNSGTPIVLVHGSWGDHHNWDPVVPALARSHRVFTYDRRGHSQSERPEAQGRLDEDAADLAALITTLGLAPAHVAANSGGAIVTLKLAASQPRLLASVAVHEPPLFAMIADHPMMPAVRQRIGAVVDLLRAGDAEGGAKLFVETIAFGPGMWPLLPRETRETFRFNAPTFLDEVKEGESVMAVDAAALAAGALPMLLSQGDESAPFFAAIVELLASHLPHAQRHTFRGAGHVPHLTASDEYAAVIEQFVDSAHAASHEGR